MAFDPTQHSHRRYNPLIGQWVLCSPHRALRPWQGGVEKPEVDNKPHYDTKCFLCPRNTRVNNNDINPDYSGAFTFTNDFPAMQLDGGEGPALNCKKSDELLRISRVRGTSKVICYTPKHNKTLATLPVGEVFFIVKEWKSIYSSFKLDVSQGMKYVQIFENKGQAMGCSNPHPHGQVWASDQVPSLPQLEIDQFEKYSQAKGKCLLCDYVQIELKTSNEKATRIVDETEHFIALVPFWATWPFEIIVIAKSHLPHIGDMEVSVLRDLALVLKKVAVRYDNLFLCDFPYSMGIHQAPLTDSAEQDQIRLSHFHIHFYPPLLRSATIKKWMVGFEMLGEAQRDLTPEQAADRLRGLPSIHYTESLSSNTINPDSRSKL